MGRSMLAAVLGALWVLLAPWPLGCGGSPPPPPRSAAQAHIEEAQAFERARRYDRAEASYRAAIAAATSTPEGTRARRAFADALIFWGKLDEARSVLEALVVEDAEAASAWHDLGLLRSKAGDLRGADAALRRAMALRPRDPRPQIALAALLVNQRHWDPALALYRGLLELELSPELRTAVTRAIELIEAEKARPPG